MEMGNNIPVAIFARGDHVRLKSRPDRSGMISGEPSLIAGEFWYPIFFGPGKSSRHPESDLESDQVTDDVREIFISGKYASRDALSKLYTHLKLVTSLRSQIYAISASRTNFYTYQFKPLLKLLNSGNQRLLISDEVGLGKTIETGLILTELKKRKDLKRILVVPPSHLVTKWQIEMRNRFELDFDVLDKKRALNFLKRYEDEGDEATLRGILSLQTLRGKALTEQWETVCPHLDIVIFDEAGRLRNTGTKSNKIASNLIENCDSAILLTATPVQTKTQDLFNLLNLLDPDEFDHFELFQSRLESNEPVLKALRMLRHSGKSLEDCLQVLREVEYTSLSKRFTDNPIYGDIIERLSAIENPTQRELIELQRDINALNVFGHIINRSRKIEVHESKPQRKAHIIPVDPSPDEMNFYNLITEYCRKEYSEHGENVVAFVAITRQRQVSSCMPAMISRYKDDIASFLDSAEISDINPEDYDVNSEDDSVKTSNPPIRNFEHLKSSLEQNDSKLKIFFKLLEKLDKEEPGRKIIVFSFFKLTLYYLQKKLLDKKIQCELISGDVPTHADDPNKDERGKRIERFRSNPDVRILLSTEVGSEGLDFQFAHILINYDLPWNPMVVEQRIGRLDRLGQKSDKVLIYNLSMKGTIEDKILHRLYNRIGIFESSIGDLEAILGEEVSQLTRDLFTRRLSPDEQERRIEQSAEVIKRRQMELEEFEQEASVLIGNDEFFMDEIDKAKQNHKYVDGEELIIYIRDFLKEHYKACRLEEADSERVYQLTVNEELRLFTRQRVASNDLGLRLFLNRSAYGSIKITTNPEIAQEDRKIDFLTFHHPLVRAITSYYNENSNELHPVSHVKLATNICKTGVYVWFLYLFEINGARPLKDIDVAVISTDNNEPLDEDDSSNLLVDMVLHGKAVPPGERGMSDLRSPDLVKLADELFVGRLKNRLNDLKRANDALVSNRLSSLEESFNRNMLKRQTLLEKAKILNRKETYIKGLETGIRNLKSQYELRRSEIEASRNIGYGYDIKGAGIVEVRNG
jgi:superfamily II DNA or RNA helicase